MRTIAVSGGFDPIHIGHVRLFEEARALGDRLIVILNNDDWLMKKKGFVFMPQDERKEVLLALRAVDDVMISGHGPDPEDMSVAAELRALRPEVFANGGDRKKDDVDIPPAEYVVADELGIELAFNVGRGGKVRSSSEMVKEAERHRI